MSSTSIMSDPTDKLTESTSESDGHEPPVSASSPPPKREVDVEVDEQTPDGGRPDTQAVSSSNDLTADEPDAEIAEPDHEAEIEEPAASIGVDDDDPPPELVWYVLKVQSSREDTIRDALGRRVKMLALDRFFGKIVVPTEKITEIRNNKKRIVERKTYPGYIMIEMELNEKTWFLVRETPGVGDFVGAHGTPTKMTDAEVNQMLGQETAKTEDAVPAKVRIDVERGDRVKIKDGPFENFDGTVEEVIEGRGLVKVMLIIFNRPTPVDLEYWQVERI
jgi:transcriptional antiterminator NusG